MIVTTRKDRRIFHWRAKSARSKVASLLKVASFMGAAVASLAATAAVEAREWNLAAMTLFDGECRMQSGAETAPCKGTLMLTEFRNGRAMLTVYRDKNSYTFSGEAGRPSQTGAFRQPIDTMRFFEGPKLLQEDDAAKGACSLTPGDATTLFSAIRCELRTGKGAHYQIAFENIRHADRKKF